jgi:hypothetical protein
MGNSSELPVFVIHINQLRTIAQFEHDARAAIARILRRVAFELGDGGPRSKLISDRVGEMVGVWKFDPTGSKND